MFESIQNLLSEHWKEILLVLIPLLILRLIRLLLHRRKVNKQLRKEKELADRLMQDEALNNEILNPERKEGDVEEKKYPYKVDYAEKGRTRRDGQAGPPSDMAGQAPGFPPEGRPAGRRKPLFAGQEMKPPGSFLKVEEHSGYSVKSYMYRQQEIMRVGSRYGKTDIIAGDIGDCRLYFEIYYQDGQFCVQSFGNGDVTIQRGRLRTSLGASALILQSGDHIRAGDKIYVVSFV